MQPEIIILASRHKPNGEINSKALIKIIIELSPDVIFEEIPPSLFNPIYSGRMTDTLETTAIKAYLKIEDTPHFPVDLDISSNHEKRIRAIFGRLHELYTKEIDSYIQDEISHREIAGKIGFEYINSRTFQSYLEEKQIREQDMIISRNDNQSSALRDEWLRFLKERRLKMIKSSIDIMHQRSFGKGLFVVGAEHVNQLLKLAGEHDIKFLRYTPTTHSL